MLKDNAAEETNFVSKLFRIVEHTFLKTVQPFTKPQTLQKHLHYMKQIENDIECQLELTKKIKEISVCAAESCFRMLQALL